MISRIFICILLACQSDFALAQFLTSDRSLAAPPRRARVVVVKDTNSVHAFTTRPQRVQAMVDRAITGFTQLTNAAEAWRSLVSTQDTVGLKIVSAPGPYSGTRPAVVEAVVRGLLGAGIPPRQIVIWDRQLLDLRLAGYFDLAERLGVRVTSSVAEGYDEKVYYETPLLGQLVYGDLEFGRKADGAGRRSFVSRLVTQQLTKIINITPLLNQNQAGVSGNLWSLALGSIDNTLRFELLTSRIFSAVPEIYALPSVGDRVALNIVDALICQYEGGDKGLLHYSTQLQEIRMSTDPVALDVLSLHDLQRMRAGEAGVATNAFELYANAGLLELGVHDRKFIQVESLP